MPEDSKFINIESKSETLFGEEFSNDLTIMQYIEATKFNGTILELNTQSAPAAVAASAISVVQDDKGKRVFQKSDLGKPSEKPKEEESDQAVEVIEQPYE